MSSDHFPTLFECAINYCWFIIMVVPPKRKLLRKRLNFKRRYEEIKKNFRTKITKQLFSVRACMRVCVCVCMYENWDFKSFLSHSDAIPVLSGNDEKWHFKSSLSHSWIEWSRDGCNFLENVLFFGHWQHSFMDKLCRKINICRMFQHFVCK